MNRQTRPPYPKADTSSSTSSAFQSSSSLSSMHSTPSPTASSAPATSAAPLPSPSSSHPPANYFTSLSGSQPVTAAAYEYRPDRSKAGLTAHETTAALSHSNLLAEAAKRAEMAVLMRDFGDVQL